MRQHVSGFSKSARARGAKSVCKYASFRTRPRRGANLSGDTKTDPLATARAPAASLPGSAGRSPLPQNRSRIVNDRRPPNAPAPQTPLSLSRGVEGCVRRGAHDFREPDLATSNWATATPERFAAPVEPGFRSRPRPGGILYILFLSPEQIKRAVRRLFDFSPPGRSSRSSRHTDRTARRHCVGPCKHTNGHLDQRARISAGYHCP